VGAGHGASNGRGYPSDSIDVDVRPQPFLGLARLVNGNAFAPWQRVFRLSWKDELHESHIRFSRFSIGPPASDFRPTDSGLRTQDSRLKSLRANELRSAGVKEFENKST
jgi:hypothetical protein